MDNIRLKMLGLPLMQTINDFSEITHISNYTIYQLSKNSNEYYLTYSILKKNGKSREIAQPSRKLKGLQSWILRNILDKLKVSNSCKGFEKNTSIADNALMHVGANAVLNLDIEDFFGSIKRNKIFNIFSALGYNNLISSVLTNLCTYNNSLPQGGPCSPKLANLCSWNLDNRIQGYVGKKGIAYTRYADDLTFSGLNPQKIINLKPFLKIIIEKEDFKINDSKTRMAGSARAKIVTGLVLYNETYGIGKAKYKILRAKIHSVTNMENDELLSMLNYINGYLTFLHDVDKKRHVKILQYIRKLNVKYSNNLALAVILDIYPISAFEIAKSISEVEAKILTKPEDLIT